MGDDYEGCGQRTGRPTMTVPVGTSEVRLSPSAVPGSRALLRFPLDTRRCLEY